jgi:signal peptidase I
MSNLSATTDQTSDTTHDHGPTPADQREHPLLELVRFALIAIIIVVPIRLFIAQPFIVSGASMVDTFHNGDYLIVDQVSYYFNEPARGEVVVFRYPKDPSKHFIKRVIGVPGDTVTIVGDQVTVTNDANPEGITLTEPYITSMSPDNRVTETLGEREYFVMGDNRDHSSDSRAWGVLQKERIVGRAWLRLYPPQDAAYLPGFYQYQFPNADEAPQ